MNPSLNDPKAGKPMADTEQSPHDGFLGRWSRRKQADQSEPEAPVLEAETTAHPVVMEDQANEATVADPVETAIDSALDDEEKLLTDDDMVPIESLNADSDYSPFFSEGVSKQLRNMALKKLFFSGKFAIRDGLDDYDDDFTKFEPLGDTITSDMKFHQRRKEKARLAKLEEERLKEEEAQNELARQQQDEESDNAETAEETSDSIEQELLAENDESNTVPEHSVLQNNSDHALNVAISGVHGGVRTIESIDDDSIDRTTSPNAKLTTIASKKKHKTEDGENQNPSSDETIRDET